jgi:hypothetical protein
MRLKVSHFLALVVIAALSVGVFAGPAAAKSSKMSAKQRAHIRAQLRKAVKKNPAVIKRKSFLKKASLVDFTLPITIKLRNSGNGVAQSPTSNPNRATVDLGASLGKRELDLGGKLGGEIQFHDSFDGGALGNVDLVLDPSTTKYLTSTSLPLLWNPNVSGPGKFWDLGLATANAAEGGCSNFTGNSNLSWDPLNYSTTDPFSGAPGVPVFDITGASPTGGYVPVNPGIDSIDNLTTSAIPGNLNNLGGNPNPFPSAPGLTTANVKDTVLRTAPLKLSIANPGDTAPVPGGPDGTQTTTIGKSGGQANLFGNIPGKTYGIDVTVSLRTDINSIIRAVDVDAQRVREGAAWPAALFDCRQAITGSVPNYIPDVHLKGSLKISPAITPAGDLRIAKASLSSLAEPYPTHVALAACLSPYSVLAAQNANNTDTAAYPVPTGVLGTFSTSQLPADTSSYARLGANPLTNPDFSAAGGCDSTQTKLTQDAGFSGLAVAQAANGYSSFATSSDGSKVSVTGDVIVNDVEADVIIGDR